MDNLWYDLWGNSAAGGKPFVDRWYIADVPVNPESFRIDLAKPGSVRTVQHWHISPEQFQQAKAAKSDQSLLNAEGEAALQRINEKHMQKEADRMWDLVVLAARASRYGE